MSATLFRVGPPGATLAVEVTGRGPAALLLHGFTGSTRTLDPIARALGRWGWCTLAVDLLGHGRADAPREPTAYALEPMTRALDEALERAQVQRAVVLGYSMGGRAALGFATQFPKRVRGLVLVGASAGLAKADERAARRAADDALARSIERDGVPAFVEKWLANPLFASQRRLGESFQRDARAQRLQNRTEGLAGSLRGFGTGVQPALHALLPKLDCPVLLVAGELDPKFREIAGELAQLLPRARLAQIPAAGHAAFLENCEAFLAETRVFLDALTAETEAKESQE